METGYIRDMQDVKILILYVLKLTELPLDRQTLYEICYVDEKLSYFDVCAALPELEANGSIRLDEQDGYSVTEKGINIVDTLSDTLAFVVRMKAEQSAEAFLTERRRTSLVKTETAERDGQWFSMAEYAGKTGCLMKLELAAPDKRQAKKICSVLEKTIPALYGTIIDDITAELTES